MATAAPPIDLFNPYISAMLVDFEQRYLPDGGLEAIEPKLRRLFSFGAARTHIRVLMEDVLSGRWGLGQTQEELEQELGIERSRVSDALRKGQLPIDIYLALMYHPYRPTWTMEAYAIRLANRAGFIAVAQYLTQYVTDRHILSDRLDEFHYELVCELFRQYKAWAIGEHTGHPGVASAVVASVCSNSALDITPSWYLPAERKHIQGLVAELTSDAQRAFDYIRVLKYDWQSIFVATIAVTEMIQWKVYGARTS